MEKSCWNTRLPFPNPSILVCNQRANFIISHLLHFLSCGPCFRVLTIGGVVGHKCQIPMPARRVLSEVQCGVSGK